MGLQLWMGNNEQTQGRWAGALHPIDNSADRERYVQLGEVEYMEEKKREALRFMLADPWREAGLIANRFVVFWSGGSQHPLDDFWKSHSLQFRGLLLFNRAGGDRCVGRNRSSDAGAQSIRISRDDFPDCLPAGGLSHAGLSALSFAYRSGCACVDWQSPLKNGDPHGGGPRRRKATCELELDACSHLTRARAAKICATGAGDLANAGVIDRDDRVGQIQVVQHVGERTLYPDLDAFGNCEALG